MGQSELKTDKPAKRVPLKERGPMPVIILTVICAVCVTLLAFTANITADARAQQKQWLEDTNKRLIFPEGDAFPAETLKECGKGIPGANTVDMTAKHPSVEQVFAAKKGDEVTGVIIQTASRGYGGSVPVMVGFTPDGTIVRIVVDAKTETAGLGQRTAEDKFTSQFTGLPAGDSFDSVDAVSSATISSNSVVASVKAASSAWAELMGKGTN